MDDVIFLRALELSDAERLVKWRNDPQITNLLGGNTFFVSLYRETEWLRKITLDDSENLRLAICLSDKSSHIGLVNLTNINWINRNAEFSILIGEKIHWGKGYAKQAALLALNYAFKELNLNRIYLKVRTDNQKALDLYKKLGFLTEGVLRNELYKNGSYISLIVMSILKNEFNERF